MKSPPPLKKQAWCVIVRGKLVEGNGLTPYELAELIEERGEEYVDTLGPTEDHFPEWHYGPYSKRQAEKLAAHLQQPDVAERERIMTAVAVPMLRWIGTPERVVGA